MRAVLTCINSLWYVTPNPRRALISWKRCLCRGACLFSSQGFSSFQICYRQWNYLQEGGGTNQPTAALGSAQASSLGALPCNRSYLCFRLIQGSLWLAWRGLCWEYQSGSKQPICFGKHGVSVVSWAADHCLRSVYGQSWPFILGDGQQFLLASCYRAVFELISIIPGIHMCDAHTCTKPQML